MTIRPATTETASSNPILMLALATLGFVVNFWAWALISPLGPMFRDSGALGELSESRRRPARRRTRPRRLPRQDRGRRPH